MTFSTVTSFYCRDGTFPTLISFYYRDVTFSTLTSFYCRDGTFPTLISFYYRDETFSTLISFCCRDVTFSTLTSLYCRDAIFSTLISFYCRDVLDLFCRSAEYFYIVFIRPWSELVCLYFQVAAIGCSRLPCIFCLKIVHLAYENRITDPSVGLGVLEKEKIGSLPSLTPHSLFLGVLVDFWKKKEETKKQWSLCNFILQIVLLVSRKIKHGIYGTEIGN